MSRRPRRNVKPSVIEVESEEDEAPVTRLSQSAVLPDAYGVQQWGEVVWDAPTQWFWVTIDWTDGSQTQEPWISDYEDPRHDGFNDGWSDTFDEFARLVELAYGFYPPEPRSTITSKQSAADHARYASRLVVMDLEWHKEIGGPISQIACTSLDGSIQFNRFIFWKHLHPTWLDTATDLGIAISAWDDRARSSSFYEAMHELVDNVPTDSVFMFYGTADESAVRWSIEFQTDTDTNERFELLSLLHKKRITFCSVTEFVRQSLTRIGMKEHCLSKSQLRKLKALKQDQRAFQQALHQISAPKLSVVVNAFLELQLTEYNVPHSELLQDHVATVVAAFNSPEFCVQYVPSKRRLIQELEFHDAVTDAMSLKVVLLLAAMATSYTQRGTSPLDRVAAIVRCLVAQAEAATRVAQLQSVDFRCTRGSILEQLWLHVHPVRGGALLALRPPKLGVVVDTGRDHVAQFMCEKFKGFAKRHQHDSGSSSASKSHGEESFTSVSSSLTERSKEKQRQQLEQGWAQASDTPEWTLQPSKVDITVYIVHCKHCTSVVTPYRQWRDNHPTFKTRVQKLSDRSGPRETATDKAITFRFCKLCKKYRDALEDTSMVQEEDEDDEDNTKESTGAERDSSLPPTSGDGSSLKTPPQLRVEAPPPLQQWRRNTLARAQLLTHLLVCASCAPPQKEYGPAPFTVKDLLPVLTEYMGGNRAAALAMMQIQPEGSLQRWLSLMQPMPRTRTLEYRLSRAMVAEQASRARMAELERIERDVVIPETPPALESAEDDEEGESMSIQQTSSASERKAMRPRRGLQCMLQLALVLTACHPQTHPKPHSHSEDASAPVLPSDRSALLPILRQ